MSVDKAINYFYRIKGRYDSEYNGAKLRIIRSDLDRSEKKRRVRNLKPKCINCKRNVGTQFSTANRHLKAVCGDTNDPCKLNINIKLGISESLDALNNEISANLNRAKDTIIEIKLQLLFGIITEEQMEEAFTSVKESYKSLLSAANMVSNEISEQQMITIKDVGGEREISRKILAAANEIKLGNLISDFKRLIKEYENDNSADTKLATMTDAIDRYLTSIVPTLDSIRNTLYKVNTVIKDKRQYKLIQLKVPLAETVLDLENPEIISNIK